VNENLNELLQNAKEPKATIVLSPPRPGEKTGQDGKSKTAREVEPSGTDKKGVRGKAQGPGGYRRPLKKVRGERGTLKNCHKVRPSRSGGFGGGGGGGGVVKTEALVI